jgi:sigma-E factor negative regulatory protein RseC
MDGGKEVLAEVLNPLGAEVGDRVRITVKEHVLLKSSLILYLLPTVGCILGSALGYFLGLSRGWDCDLAAIICGFLFLGMSFGIVDALSRRQRQGKGYWPEIREIIARSGPEEPGTEILP